MVEVLVKLKLNMQAAFNTDFHLHLVLGFSLLHVAIEVQHSEI